MSMSTATPRKRGLYAGLTREEGRPVVDECPDGGRKPCECFARFEYFRSICEDDSPERAGRPHNLFGGFTLLARCCQCQHGWRVAHYECA